MAKIAMTPQAMAQIPAARPSSPSLRLTAFVTPTIHRTVKRQPQPPRWTTHWSVRAILEIRTPAQAQETGDHQLGRQFESARANASDRRPAPPERSARRAQQQRPTATASGTKPRRRRLPRTGERTIAHMADRKIATPPMRGTGPLVHAPQSRLIHRPDAACQPDHPGRQHHRQQGRAKVRVEKRIHVSSTSASE